MRVQFSQQQSVEARAKRFFAGWDIF